MNLDCTTEWRGARIDIKNVSVIYKTKDGSKLAIKDINFIIQPNEFVSIVGPSGCGKSTLLRVVAGLIRPSQGEVLFDGILRQEMPNPFATGYVFQDAALLEWRTVYENVILPLELKDTEKNEANNIAIKLIDLVGLKGFINNYPHELSGGMRQRVSIARALSSHPRLLLMDEPFSALDEMTRERMNTELLRIWNEAKSTVIFVTHNLFEAVYLADRVIVLSQLPGRVVADVSIPIGRPRTEAVRDDETFHQTIQNIRSLLSTKESQPYA